MKKERFGESFKIDSGNRMEVLKDSGGLPEYVRFSRELRKKMNESLTQEGWPECPAGVKTLEDLFGRARETVSKKWVGLLQPSITGKLQEWKSRIAGKKGNEELFKLLSDPEKLENQLKIRQFGVLEPLRSVLPEAWRTLVFASSERQLASVALLRHWSKELTNEDIDRLGISEDELDLFLDTAGILGKYIDHAYVKQIELADQPGGSAKTKFTGVSGAEHVYDIYIPLDKNRGVDMKPYIEVFPFEFEKIAKRFKLLGERTQLLLAEHKIPATYSRFPQYLKQLSEVYGSKEVTPKKLDKMWEKLEEESVKLTQDGCPVMVVPQGTPSVAGEADKVDVEIRLGFRTPQTRELESFFEDIRNSAQQVVDKNKARLQKPYKIPPAVLNFQPFAFGPNLYWMTRGEEGESIIVSHTNAVIDVAVSKEIPILEKIFHAESSGIDEEKYKKAAIIETVSHEIGHTVMSIEDEVVKKRLGVNNESTVLEELKAETWAVKLWAEKLVKSKDLTGVWESQFLAKIGTLFDYLINKSGKTGDSGERYYYSGVAIIYELLNQGALEKENGTCKIKDVEKGIKTIGDMGDEILKRFYINEQATPEDVKKYIGELRKKKDDIKMKDLLAELKS